MDEVFHLRKQLAAEQKRADLWYAHWLGCRLRAKGLDDDDVVSIYTAEKMAVAKEQPSGWLHALRPTRNVVVKNDE